MDYFLDNPIIMFFVIALVICLLVFVGSFCAYKYQVEVAQANIVKVYRGAELLYQGKLAFVNIQSGGMTTTIIIYKKLFPFGIIEATYSDSNIKVEK